MGNYKPFDKSLYAENDKCAKEAAISLWSKHGYKMYENPDQYGPDLIVEKNGEKVFIEVEVKYAWTEDEFYYPDLQIAERKKKFAELSEKLYFLVFSSDLTNAFLCPKEAVLESPLEQVRTKFSNNERFFKIPVSKLTQIRIS